MPTYWWKPPRDIVDSANVTSFMEKHGIPSYRDFVSRSISEYKWFWWNLPGWIGVEWFREPRELWDLSRGVEWAKWFRGGLVNLAHNILDRHVKSGLGDREAFTWVGEDGSERRLTYAELKADVDRLARFFDEIGVGRGDVVSIYAPMMPESVIAMIAAFKVGAIASPIFSGFAPSAVAERIRLAGSRVVVTVDGYLRRGRVVRLKDRADEAIELAGGVDTVIVARRLGIEVGWVDGRDVYYGEAVSGKRPQREPEELDPEHPALLLFTSGTTGKPKGAVISHIGALVQPPKEHYFNFDVKPGWEGGGDRMWWITDIGWMMGPWQVIGSQFHASSHLMVEGAIDYPSKTRVWSLIEKYRVTLFGFAATVARILKRMTPKIPEEFDLSSLRAFGNTGEPIDPDTWLWVMREVGGEERPFINITGGTELFGCFLLPSPVVELKPSTLWGPSLGMSVDVYDDEGRSVRGVQGYLVATKPAPSMTRGLWRDPERYIETYWSRFPGVWYHGDLALVDSDGHWFVLGRADDVIKVAGRRIGPAEIESVINEHPLVAESACVGVPHEVKGEAIACFAVLREGAEKRQGVEDEIAGLVEERMGKPFRPEAVEIVSELPRTRSGKIMRRLIRQVLSGEMPEPPPVLENPGSLSEIAAVRDRVLQRVSG